MTNFWKDIKNPIFALAPMEDVTDTVFRELVMSVADPSVLNVVFTEFTSVDGMTDERGFESVSQRLIVNASEIELLKKRNTKLVAQIWGNDPEKFKKVSEYISKQKVFDGIDINMGCPVKKVVKKATCSALIKYPEQAAAIVDATKEGTHLPVSVKTRIGFDEIETERWIPQVLAMRPTALTIHGRIQKQMSTGEANYAEIGKAVNMAKEISPETRIIGNGDIETYQQGMEKINAFSLDGVMVGRGIFKNPWMFNKTDVELDVHERLRLLKSHVDLYRLTWDEDKNYNILKRFYKIYLNSFSGAGYLRAELMKTKSFSDFDMVSNELMQGELKGLVGK